MDWVYLGHQTWLDDGADPHLVDLDNDGVPEIETNDWAFAYWEAPFGLSPAPRVVLKYHRGRYRVWAPLMRKPPPSAAELRARARKVVITRNWVQETRWANMLTLAYTGHARLARRFLDLAWPTKVPGKRKWLRSFRERLRESQYWNELKAIDGNL